tara:strand:+ start:430 stop:696 length:267 start_codon:yes stop_codon:yes gene_type:complete
MVAPIIRPNVKPAIIINSSIVIQSVIETKKLNTLKTNNLENKILLKISKHLLKKKGEVGLTLRLNSSNTPIIRFVIMDYPPPTPIFYA